MGEWITATPLSQEWGVANILDTHPLFSECHFPFCLTCWELKFSPQTNEAQDRLSQPQVKSPHGSQHHPWTTEPHTSCRGRRGALRKGNGCWYYVTKMYIQIGNSVPYHHPSTFIHMVELKGCLGIVPLTAQFSKGDRNKCFLKLHCTSVTFYSLFKKKKKRASPQTQLFHCESFCLKKKKKSSSILIVI